MMFVFGCVQKLASKLAYFLCLNFWVLAEDCDRVERKCDQKNGEGDRPEKLCDHHRKDFSSPEEQRVFEETFTDWLWRLVSHVEDSLNSAGLLASTTLLLMPACKSNDWSPFRLQSPLLQVRGRQSLPRALRRGTTTGLSSNHRWRRSCQIPL